MVDIMDDSDKGRITHNMIPNIFRRQNKHYEINRKLSDGMDYLRIGQVAEANCLNCNMDVIDDPQHQLR